MPAMPVHSHYNFFRELCRQCLYTLTTIFFESYASDACTLSLQFLLEVTPKPPCTLPQSFSRVKPATPVRSCYNSFWKLCRELCALSCTNSLKSYDGEPV